MTTYYRSHRLRTGRYSEPGRIYLLTAITLDREPVFEDFYLARQLTRCLRQAQDEGLASSLAWVVMPDHLHWLVELHEVTLDELMRKTKSRAARVINHQAGRMGPLWQSGFHDRAIRREEDLLAITRYIVANPLRAGLVERVGDYPLWDAIWL
ncbi:REP-associated tyrosine transposase [Pseudomonas gingeri]|uniref:Transposase n=1 Tax=Pseudomonas gingeri TaxID=117681 RepID=A0A7Y7Y823_9PSED|nr:transposase [Pseudomonas gingeri]NWB30734.1 transposase [Pseudomonas gingeri]NWC31418.1 transposase [Pseudomonas gingeri]NWD09113.1 transposase [Pseudomonas gingeri]NWD49685.1 transposase [Pseudomonas gingeri]NWE35044.1 transposase [Pseudomonas gingeri]